MSQQQIALFTLTQISTPGNLPPGSYTISINAGSEPTQIDAALTPGVPSVFTEHLKGLVPPAFGSMSLPVSVTISGGPPFAPISGSKSATFTIPLMPPVQPFSLTVVIATVNGTYIIPVNFEIRFRELPVSYNPEWLCSNRYNYAAFYRWLCLGNEQIGPFNSLPEVISFKNTIMEHLLRLGRVAVALGAPSAPAGPSLLEQSAYVTDVVMAATNATATTTWAHRYIVEDFLAPYEEKFEDVVVATYLVIDPQVMELCRRWRELLDCFCKFCANRVTMPAAAVSYFDTSVMPVIDTLFPQVQSVAVSESMPVWISAGPFVDCNKLRYIVSFWAWWCRVCGPTRLSPPGWSVALEPSYTSLYDKREFLNDLLEVEDIKLCNPPEKNYCDRWLGALNCLKKLCDAWGDLPGAMSEDLIGYFLTPLRDIYTFLKLTPPVAQMDQGEGLLCQLVSKLQGYFTRLCTPSLSPWSHLRRTALDNFLVTLEGRMTTIKSLYGDICADRVEMTDCEEWDTLLGCLQHLCQHRHILSEDLAGDLLHDVEPLIDAIHDALPTQLGGSQPSSLDRMCAKISLIVGDIADLCENDVDPLLRIRLDLLLGQLQSRMLSLQGEYSGLCDTSTSLPPGWCDDWLPKLRCLKRYCDRRSILDQQVVDDFVDELGDVLDKLDWVLNDHSSEYEAPVGTQSMAMVCVKLAAILDSLRQICNDGTIDPLVKSALDDLLEEFEDAYDAFTELHNSLCNNVDTLCEQWIDILDCVTVHHERWSLDTGNTRFVETVNAINSGIGTYVEQTYTTVSPDPSLPGMTPGIERWAYIHRSLLEWFATHCACCDSVDSGTRDYLQSQLNLVENVYVNLPFCGTSCTTTQLSLKTGVAPWKVTLVDDDEVDPPGPVYVVNDPGITVPKIGGADWISPHTSRHDGEVGWTMFQRCFCLCRAADVRILFTFLADDYADIYVDDTLIYSAASHNMTVSETCDKMVYLTAGEHCVRVKVRNEPALYMYMGGNGSIMAPAGTLMTDNCCNGEDETIPDPCAKAVNDCDKLTMIPRMYRMICCVTIDPLDSINSSQAMTSILNSLTCIERLVERIALELGIPSATFPLTGSTLCERLRRMLMFAMFSYAGQRSLSPYVRRSLDCFIQRLCQALSTLQPQLAERPLSCSTCCVDCDRWFELFVCLCRLCRIRRPATPTQGATLTQFDAVIGDELATLYQALAAAAAEPLVTAVPMGPVGMPAIDICEMLRRSTLFLGSACLYCTPIPAAQRTIVEQTYLQLRTEYDRLRTELTTTFTGSCTDVCPSWTWRLECLYRVALRRGELPSALVSSFDAKFSARITSLFNAISPAPAGAGAPGSSLVATTTYKLMEVIRALDLYCGPCRTMPAGLASLLSSTTATFLADHNTFQTQLADAGITFCSQSPDVCARLYRLPDTAAILCGAAPASNDPVVIALEDLFTRLQSEIAATARILRLPSTLLPGGVFCNRLEFVVGLLASVWARYSELPPRARAAMDFLDERLAAQAAAYATMIAGSLPRPDTAMSAYRAGWLELLRCICNACALVAGMTAQERTNAADLVTFVESAGSELATAVNTVYSITTANASVLPMPIVTDPCATDLCRRARIAASFFVSYCLRCDAPDSGLVAALNPGLEALRAATVLLRSKLFAIGRNVCGEENEGAYTMQSQSLYLQAVGSNGFSQSGDGSAAGVHLRWALLGDLGRRHLPKGVYTRTGSEYFASFGYNKPDDNVVLHRTRYVDTDLTRYFPARIDLTAATTRRPSTVVIGADMVEWTYVDVPVDGMFASAKTSVTLRFMDKALYRTVRADNVTPTTPQSTSADVAYIIGAYTGTLEVETFPKLMFAMEVIAVTPAAMTTKMEAVSLNEDLAAGSPTFLSARMEYLGAGQRHKVISEAVQYFRLRYSGSVPTTILVETYADFYTATRRRYLWTKVGAYALSLDTTTVAKRLEPAPNTVDGKWPKYGTEGVGTAARVNTDNYMDRWLPNRQYLPDGSPDPSYNPSRPEFGRHPDQSLHKAVQTYLEKSRNADEIEAWVEQESAHTGDSSLMNISILRMLLLASQDYHVARMLGLGTIDPDVPLAGDAAGQQYIYMAEYETPAQSGPPATSKMMHRYLSLPTGRNDYRLPVTPAITGFVYGLHPDYTDVNGYTKYGDARFVKVNRGTVPIDLSVGGFFDNSLRFSHGTGTRPIQFGIKVIKLDTSNPRTWRLLHPVNDQGDFESVGYKPYKDDAGNPEIHGIPDVGNPMFVHMVENIPENHGQHRYAIYGINWFSRASAALTFPDIVDNTFPKRNTLLPPANLTAQYIQREVPPVLTSPAEQDRYEDIKKRTRVLFDWNHTHTMAYQSADRVDFFFRTDPPVVIRGKVKSAAPVSGSGDMIVETEGYTEPTADPSGGAVNVVPAITQAQVDNAVFQGSVFATAAQQFVVVEVAVGGGGNARFRLAKLDRTDENGQSNAERWTPPAAGTIFMVTENLANKARWRALPSSTIMLADFTRAPYPVAPLHEEELVENGQRRRLVVGGLFEAGATIQAVHGPDDQPGVFKITCNTMKLYPYDQQFPANPWLVEFYRGTVRVPDTDRPGRMKVVTVVKFLENAQQKLELYVYDPSNSIGPQSGQAAIDVNFHPSYRAYIDLHLDSVPESDVLPIGTAPSRQTFIASRSLDAAQSFESPLTPAAVHTSRRVVEAVKPLDLRGPRFATRPDFYGKSSCSVDMPIAAGRSPYGMIFYRGDEETLLRALYSQETIDTVIRPQLNLMAHDSTYYEMWGGLVTVDVEPSGANAGKFKQYGGFRMPVPDNGDALLLDPANPGEYRQAFVPQRLPGAPAASPLPSAADDIRAVIAEAMVPLTERPLLYDLITVDQRLQTSSSKPVLRDIHGVLLAQGDSGFDPYPMARRKTTGETVLRFTDYTVDGASANIFFYCAREISNTLVRSVPSAILGPVRTVNTRPSPAPVIRYVTSEPPIPGFGSRPEVVVTIAPYLALEGIDALRLYRALNTADAVSTRSMTPVADYALAAVEITADGWRLRDSFTNIAPPYGQPLFYRVVALRHVEYEHLEAIEEEVVESLPSEVVLVNVVDTSSPVSPPIDANYDEYQDPQLDNAVTEYRNVVLTWHKSTPSSDYSLQKMQRNGDWKQVAFVAAASVTPTMSHTVGTLPKLVDGTAVYHRYRVIVTNSYGLRSSGEVVLTL